MSNNKTPRVSIWLLIVLIIVIIAAWVLTGYFLYGVSDRGTFGDMFGTINALFAGLAFAGIIYAIFLQRKDLELQRRELQLTREELDGQKQQLQAQNDTLKRQAFQNTFFQLLELHNDIVKSLVFRYANGEISSTGRECFQYYYDELKIHYDSFPKQKGENDEIKIINSSYEKLFVLYQADLGHYFRNLYNLVKYVKNSQIEDKKVFTNIVRAQLSSYELALLFYDCVSELGRGKFKPLVEEFSLFNNLSQDLIFDPNHLQFFDYSAYRGSEPEDFVMKR